MRLFVALDIDDVIRERLLTFVEGVRGFAPEARWVRPESLHVTLKFIGEKTPAIADQIKQVLSGIVVPSFDITLQGYGFFPTPKAPRVFWVGIQSGPELPRLARSVDEETARLGVPKEDHGFTPHLTLARRGGGSGALRWHKDDSPNESFQRLGAKLTAMPAPDFGTMTAREFFLYESQPSRDGHHYRKLERFVLPESAQPTTRHSHNP